MFCPKINPQFMILLSEISGKTLHGKSLKKNVCFVLNISPSVVFNTRSLPPHCLKLEALCIEITAMMLLVIKWPLLSSKLYSVE